ncbi:DUF6355 family natural product biosynthesis protein [Streptomyces sp. NBC_00249]|uniref:DUF6355 family natural product biosynthesis protein n=1 Tax=Streptomyces sp. NBC_00249 TaxID=2975690 RepID=UPI00224E7602|nr:DUF6355 family natural product biosynthesis protein [Streptomyces sp. NBC_00249]MCX5194419.1 DUF6355 family natural product biosynthesis protein [Streptomyces sp. NBC_00249]
MTFLRTKLRTTAAVALTIGTLALLPTSASAGTAAAPASLAGCGWNEGRGGERAYYEHCATDTNVWIQVKRWPRSNYHRCVGPGRTNLDADATGAWYDSNYRGGLCSHPGDTGD